MDNLTGSPPTAKLTSDREGAVSGSIRGNLTTETSPVVEFVGADMGREPRATRGTKPFELIRADILMQMPDEPEDDGRIRADLISLSRLREDDLAIILDGLRAIGATPSLHEAQKMARDLADRIEGART